MRKLITTISFAVVLPSMASNVHAESALTPFISEGLSLQEAVPAALAANPDLSLVQILEAALEEGASIEDVMKIALSIPVNCQPDVVEDSEELAACQRDAVAAVTAAAANYGFSSAQIIAAAQIAGIPGDVAAAGIIQGAGTAAGPDDSQDQATNNTEQVGQPTINGFIPPTVPTPPVNAGQPVIPTPPPNTGTPVSPNGAPV